MNTELSRHILLFAEVARQLNFSHAADILGVSKGYLSQQIKQLENTLGTTLLYRSTRKVSLTPEGQLLLTQAEKLEQVLVETQQQIHDQQDTLEGVLSLTAPAAFAERYLVRLCDEFVAQNPRVECVFDVGNHRQDLQLAEFDIAFRITHNPPENVVARHLMTFSNWCVASPSYLDKHGTPNTPDELSNHNCISLSFWRKWAFFANREGYLIDVKGSVSYPQNDLLRKSALLHQGIINVPDYVVDEDVSEGKLTAILSNYVAEPKQVYMLYPQRTVQPAKVRAFVSFMLGHPIWKNENRLSTSNDAYS